MTPTQQLSDDPRERHASWLELFFDLLFVAIVAQLAHGLVGHVTAGRVLAVAGLFCPLWWFWVSFSYFSDAEERDTPAHRLGVLTMMACLLVAGGGIPGALHGDPMLFALGSGLARLARTSQWMVNLHHRFGRATTARASWPYLLSALLWLVSAATPAPPTYGLWALGLGVEAVSALHTPAGAATAVRNSIDAPHLVERFGLFVIIALGEGIAQVVAAVGTSHHVRSATVLTGLSAFALLSAVWWLYFDFGNETALVLLRTQVGKEWRLVRDGFAFGHLFLVGGIVALSAGLGTAVSAVARSAAAPDALRLVCASLFVYLLNNAVVGVALKLTGPRVTATWLLPDAVVVAAVWAAADRVPAGWAFLLLAVVLLAVSAPSVLRRWASRPPATRP